MWGVKSLSNSTTGFLISGDKRFELTECTFNQETEIQKTIEDYVEPLEKLFGIKLFNCGKVQLSNILEADLVFIGRKDYDEGADYIPIVLELKRMDNREVRREVLAQLLEYMTSTYLNPEPVIDTCKSKGIEFDEDNLKENIEKRNIWGVIVSESIPDIVKKTIEFLNEELSSPELYGVEFKRLCTIGNREYSVIIPSLIGATTEAERAKQESNRTFWSYEKLIQTYNEIENDLLRNRLIDLLNWARETKLLKEYYSNDPRFQIADIINVNPEGTLYVKFGKKYDSKLPKTKRQQLLKELQNLGMLPLSIEDPDIATEGRVALKSIDELSDDEYTKLKNALAKIFLN